MLENAPARQIVLADGERDRLHVALGHGEPPPGDMPGKSERVLVAVDEAVIEIGALVVPVAQAERLPALLFVDERLAAFKLALLAVGYAEDRPGRIIGPHPGTVRPEDGARLLVLGQVEQKCWIDQRYVVGIKPK